MTTDRLEIRLDPRRRDELRKLAATRGEPVSEVVRQAIDRELAAAGLERRLAAVRRIAAMNLPVPDDPADMKREYEDAASMPELDDFGNRIPKSFRRAGELA